MSYACLMVYVEADATPEQRVRLAVSLADQFNAMLIGLAALAIPPPMTTDGVIMDMMRTKLAHRGEWFRRIAGANHRKVDWRAMLDFPGTAVSGEARSADLVIVGQAKAPCEQWLTRTNASRPPDERLLMPALAAKSVALAARRFTLFNGFYHDGKFQAASAVHLGIAIAIRGGGLAAPALHDVDQMALDELMGRMRDLVQRTRAGRIRSSEMSDSTITLSSLGERGVETLYGIIYPPQVALVGFGKVGARPWLVDGAIGPR